LAPNKVSYSRELAFEKYGFFRQDFYWKVLEVNGKFSGRSEEQMV